MAIYTSFTSLVNGIQRSIDISSNTLQVGSLATASYTLTDSILGRLLALQNGSDVGSAYHSHDVLYTRTTALAASSGSTLIGDNNSYSYFTPSAATVKGALAGIDAALGSASAVAAIDTVFVIKNFSDNTKKIAFSAGGISTGQTRTITMPDANVDLGNLTNSNISGSAAIAYSKLNLASSIVNADVSGSAAIAYSKLNLASSIVNADVAAGAAIAVNKLAALTASKAVATDGSGFLVASATSAVELGYVSGVSSAIQTQLNHKIQDDGSVAFAANQPMGGFKLTNLAAGSSAADSVNYGQVILKSGVNTFTANQPMGGFKLTGLAAGASPGDSVRFEQVVRIDGSNDFTNNQSMGGFKLTNLANGSSANDAVNFSQLQAVSTGLIWINGVQDPDLVDDSLSTPPGSPTFSITYIIAASPTGAWTGLAGHAVWWDGANWIDVSTNAIAASGFGTAVQVGDRFGVAIATAGAAGHIGGGLAGKANYIAQISSNTPGSIAYTFSAPVAQDAFSVLSAGSQHFGQSFVYSSTTTSWIDFSGPSKVIAGAALGYSGNTLNVQYDNSTIDLTANKLEVKAGGLTNTQINSAAAIAYSKLNLATSIVNGDINAAAAIAYSKLSLAGSIVNADVSASAAIVYSKLSLSNSIMNGDINASAAIAYSKLSLAGSIVNADIATGAAIAYSKLALSNTIVNADINSAAAIAYSKLALSASIVNADINAAAAIAYSKLNLATSIVNADINAAAAIAYSKLALSNSIVAGDLTSSSVTTAKIAALAVDNTKLASNVFDQVTITQSSGVAAAVQSAPLLKRVAMVAGESFAADTSFAVRFGMNSLSETAGRVYKADDNASVNDKFWVIGMAKSVGGVIAGGSIDVVVTGEFLLGSNDTSFSSGDLGKPVWLGASGAFTTTAPSSAGLADFKIGMVDSLTSIFVDRQMMAIG